jgi:outer membrane lipoprotein-sorting protein
MKKLLGIICFVALACVAVAQTPQEIISRMEAELDKHESEGIIMTVDVKVPILGLMTTKTYTLGNKTRADAVIMGTDIITWTDGKTSWKYNAKKNEVEIAKLENEITPEDDTEMFDGITDDYDVSINKETANTWILICKKLKSNKDKDVPKRMELVVTKGTFMPVSLKTKLSGMTITMRDISFGVTEKQVTFNAKDYPGLTIVDKR